MTARQHVCRDTLPWLISFSLGFYPTMLQINRRQRAMIGFRVKSGWAAAVLVTGPIDAPVVCDATAIELSDPKVPAQFECPNLSETRARARSAP